MKISIQAKEYSIVVPYTVNGIALATDFLDLLKEEMRGNEPVTQMLGEKE